MLKSEDKFEFINFELQRFHSMAYPLASPTLF